ncbi:MAG: sugar transferase [Parasporobacterium sp.]|nr:sugar transferase [Parasporobacterium sp.]
MYAKFIKRILDAILSAIAIVILSPTFVFLIIMGLIKMKGNPFFTQQRPGLHEKIFKLIKFRTMTNEKDNNGELLPDEKRLNRYGRFLRSTSLDELPELFNIFIGNMAIIGPRPLLVRYLPRYNEQQHHRHDVRPGLTGYAQVHGRNALTWSEKFKLDVWYTEHVTFKTDLKIIFSTIKIVAKREGISSDTSETMEEFLGNEE